MRFFALALFILASLPRAEAAISIWEAHAMLVAAEQITDQQVHPVYKQLFTKGAHTESTQEDATSARLRLESAREEFIATFRKLDATTKKDFIASLSQVPDDEVLMYDLEEISPLIPRIAEIRRAQAEKLNKSGRSGLQAVNPRPLDTTVIEVDTGATAEINGSSLPRNHFALTFDDGPLPETSRSILASLAEWGVRVNYFQCGNRIAALSGNDSELLSEMHAAGHGIENHSWSHAQLTTISMDAVRKEIDDTFAIIEQKLASFGYRSSLLRFPYGARNQSLIALLRARNVTSIMWNIDTLDWKYRDPAVVIDLARQQIQQQGRGVILMHDIHTQTALAVPHILQILSDRNSTMVKFEARR